MEQERFLEACRWAASRENIRQGIGTLGEKTLHSAVKYYFQPDPEKREVPVGPFVADALVDGGVVEVQTRSLYRLRPKLEYFLAQGKATVVYPVRTEGVELSNLDKEYAIVDGTYYAPAGTSFKVDVTDENVTDFIFAADDGTRAFAAGAAVKADGATVTMGAGATAVMAAVTISPNSVEVNYDKNGVDTQINSGEYVAVGTELTFDLANGVYGTSVVDANNNNAELTDGVKVGNKAMAPSGAFTVNFTGMTVQANGTAIQSGDKVVKGATIAATIDTKFGTTVIELTDEDSLVAASAYAGGTLSGDLTLAAAVKVTRTGVTSVTLENGGAEIANNSYVKAGTRLMVTASATTDTISVNVPTTDAEFISNSNGVAVIELGIKDVTISET